MAKTLVVLILLFDGTLIHDRIEFHSLIDMTDCGALGEAHREIVSTYSWGDQSGAPNFTMDYMKQGWYLNDGRGTIQGHYCE